MQDVIVFKPANSKDKAIYSAASLLSTIEQTFILKIGSFSRL